MGEWFRTAPIWLLGLLLFVATVGCALAGARVNRWYTQRNREQERLSESQAGHVVSMIYALLSLLIGFTFQMAAERFEVRRQLVREDAIAIETLYLKAQLLADPYRSTLSGLLVRYAENHLALAQVRREDSDARRLMADDDQLRRELWTALIPAFDSIKDLDFSTSLVESSTEVVRVDTARRAARGSPIPTTIILGLIFYSLVAAAGLGAIMKSRKGEIASAFLLGLSALALMLISDLNRPVDGTIHESQEPMRQMLVRLQNNPPTVFQPIAAQPH
ncbi:hypothetical protein GCM10022276_28030 [Sphingomonas limnosediminicola]|jgi:hypothetical protein|uniref:DUF4239 domain-containing protein n=1 Tax=Sphingomonas limnosediminicola TaxID=940133 RepID=A0ABP7LXR7_9SPHN